MDFPLKLVEYEVFIIQHCKKHVTLTASFQKEQSLFYSWLLAPLQPASSCWFHRDKPDKQIHKSECGLFKIYIKR